MSTKKNDVLRLFGILLLWIAAAGFTTTAQTVSGTITGDDGTPVVGATVIVEGSGTGTSADIDGKFTIAARKGQVLKVSCIGYVPQKVKIEQTSGLNIVLKEDSNTLDDVVVIGYGTTERKRVTSAITTIKGDDLTRGIGGSTIATAMQGKIPGLTINTTNNPNASSPGFQLRGVASVNSSQGPLVVIDGIPGGDIRMLNQDDIESIDVLKDASAGAIYGTRAAGGVILITTKNGQAGKTKVTYSTELSIDHLRKRPEMLSAEEFVAEGLGYDWGSNTDWYGEMINNNAFSNKHTMTLSGGTENANVYASLMYNNDNGLIKKNSRTDYSGRINANFKIFDGKLELSTRLQVRQSNRNTLGSVGRLYSAMKLNPTIPLMSKTNPNKYNVNEDGLGGTTTSPVADLMYRDFEGRDQWMTAAGTIKYHIIPGLDIQASANIDYRQYRSYSWRSADHLTSIENNKKGWASHSYSMDRFNSYEAYASYRKSFGAHNIDAVGGWSFWENAGDGFSAENSDFTIEGVGPWNLGEGSDLKEGQAGMSSSKDSRQRLIAMFVRANYSYDDKYLLTASYRREGSSKFGANNRWGNFWAVSGGWRINREEFMKDIDWVNDLKVRVGYGVTGNNGLPAGLTTTTYTNYGEYPFQGVWQTCWGPQRNVNPDIKWEEKHEINVGFDFSLFNNRLWGRFDWYKRKVNDMIYLLNVPVPPNVLKTCYYNVGDLSNNGWEVEVGGNILNAGGVKWDATVRAFGNKSKIGNLGYEGAYVNSENLPDPGSPGAVTRISAQSNIGEFWLYRNAGIDENGKFLIYNKDGEVVPASSNLNIDNRVYMGNALPKVILSMDHNVSWRNFDLGIQLRAWVDHDVFNGYVMYNGIGDGSQANLIRDYYYKHKDIKDNTKVISDYFLEDASFLKIDAITLGYTFNAAKYNKYVKNVRVYVTARDVATFTHYSGYDPEVNINGLFPGIEWPHASNNTTTLYPQSTRYTFGLQLTF